MALKGIGYRSDTLANVARIKSLNPKWWYNWNQKRLMGTPDQISAEWIPMLYSDSSNRLPYFKADMDAEKALIAPAKIPAILGFNEPDHPEQSDMTPLEALNSWHFLMESGWQIRKGSPANVSTVTPWADKFMGAQKALDLYTQSWERDFEVNFIATHIYMNPDAGTWLRKVDDLYAKFGKPIWVTETCVHDSLAKDAVKDAAGNIITPAVPNRYSRAQVEQFMRDIWAGVQTRSYVERVAWHTRDINDPIGVSGSLFNEDGTLTSTGVVWRDIDKTTNP